MAAVLMKFHEKDITQITIIVSRRSGKEGFSMEMAYELKVGQRKQRGKSIPDAGKGMHRRDRGRKETDILEQFKQGLVCLELSEIQRSIESREAGECGKYQIKKTSQAILQIGPSLAVLKIQGYAW